MKKESILERELFLKYFHLVDPNTIVKEITQSDAYNNYLKDKHNPPSGKNTEKLFRHIFYAILNHCRFQMSCINPYSQKFTFFGTGKDDKDKMTRLNKLSLLCQEALFNHCIIHSYFNQLSSNEVTCKLYRLSGAQKSILESGHFSYIVTPEEDIDDIKKAHGLYGNYKKSMYENLKNGAYSYELLVKWFVPSGQDIHNSPTLEVPSFCRYWANYIYSNRYVRTFEKHMSAVSKISNSPLESELGIRVYENLHQNINTDLCSDKKEFKIDDMDQFVSETVFEKIYGFQYFNYLKNLFFSDIFKYLPHIAIDEPSSDHLVLELLASLNKNNITYNKGIFIKYALEAIENTVAFEECPVRMLNNSALSPNNKTLAIYQDKTYIALNYFSYYVNTLNYLVMPLLESLWLIIIDKLNNETSTTKSEPCKEAKKLIPSHQLNIEKFERYIRQNATKIQTDYALFDDNDLQQISISTDFNSTIENFKIPKSLSRKYCDYELSLNELKRKKNHSVSSLFYKTLQLYCNSDHYNESPYIFDDLFSLNLTELNLDYDYAWINYKKTAYINIYNILKTYRPIKLKQDDSI